MRRFTLYLMTCPRPALLGIYSAQAGHAADEVPDVLQVDNSGPLSGRLSGVLHSDQARKWPF